MSVTHKYNIEHMNSNSSKPNDSVLEGLMKDAADLAAYKMRENGEVLTEFIASTPTYRLVLRGSPLRDEAAKDAYASFIRLWCIAAKVKAGVLVAESWMVNAEPGKPLDLSVRPSLSPRRREIVFLAGEALGSVYAYHVLPLLRDATGRFTGFGPTETFPPELIEGRYKRLLPPHNLSDAQRRTALRILITTAWPWNSGRASSSRS